MCLAREKIKKYDQFVNLINYRCRTSEMKKKKKPFTYLLVISCTRKYFTFINAPCTFFKSKMCKSIPFHVLLFRLCLSHIYTVKISIIIIMKYPNAYYLLTLRSNLFRHLKFYTSLSLLLCYNFHFLTSKALP